MGKPKDDVAKEWKNKPDTMCTATLKIADYTNLDRAKAACAAKGSECGGVYEGYCGGHRFKLCVPNKLGPASGPDKGACVHVLESKKPKEDDKKPKDDEKATGAYWKKITDTVCTKPLEGEDYDNFEKATSACLAKGSECDSVYEGYCDGKRFKLCPPKKLMAASGADQGACVHVLEIRKPKGWTKFKDLMCKSVQNESYDNFEKAKSACSAKGSAGCGGVYQADCGQGKFTLCVPDELEEAFYGQDKGGCVHVLDTWKDLTDTQCYETIKLAKYESYDTLETAKLACLLKGSECAGVYERECGFRKGFQLCVPDKLMEATGPDRGACVHVRDEGWEHLKDTMCEGSLENESYDNLEKAKSACSTRITDCRGVYESDCGKKKFQLCIKGKFQPADGPDQGACVHVLGSQALRYYEEHGRPLTDGVTGLFKDTVCTETLKIADYTNLELAKSVCLAKGSECGGVYEGYCGGNRFKLCVPNKWEPAKGGDKGACVHVLQWAKDKKEDEKKPKDDGPKGILKDTLCTETLKIADYTNLEKAKAACAAKGSECSTSSCDAAKKPPAKKCPATPKCTTPKATTPKKDDVVKEWKDKPDTLCTETLKIADYT